MGGSGAWRVWTTKANHQSIGDRSVLGRLKAAPRVAAFRTSHNQFRGLRLTLLPSGAERFRPIGRSAAAAPAGPSRLFLAAVVHDFRLAPDGSHQAFFG